MNTELLNRPCCGSAAEYKEGTGENQGGIWIECTKCHLSSEIVFPAASDPKPWLAEKWNSRVSTLYSATCIPTAYECNYCNSTLIRHPDESRLGWLKAIAAFHAKHAKLHHVI